MFVWINFKSLKNAQNICWAYFKERFYNRYNVHLSAVNMLTWGEQQ
jgi:hypothetical protein